MLNRLNNYLEKTYNINILGSLSYKEDIDFNLENKPGQMQKDIKIKSNTLVNNDADNSREEKVMELMILQEKKLVIEYC